jgi:hypothetical protein
LTAGGRAGSARPTKGRLASDSRFGKENFFQFPVNGAPTPSSSRAQNRNNWLKLFFSYKENILYKNRLNSIFYELFLN